MDDGRDEVKFEVIRVGCWWTLVEASLALLFATLVSVASLKAARSVSFANCLFVCDGY